MRRIAFVLEYDGTHFSGSQYQPNARTVQGELETAARLVLKIGSDRVRLAGRTDAGVHATAQVAACDTHSDISTQDLPNAMNGNLPRDIAVRQVYDVSHDFDPRRTATGRTYLYVINDSGIRSPLNRRHELLLKHPLDTETIALAVERFIGTHDFASFAVKDRGEQQRPTVRHINAFTAARRRDDNRLILRVTGGSFLRQQVRRMVGLLIAIGIGRSPAADITRHLQQPSDIPTTDTAPAHGLTLTQVSYPAGTLALPETDSLTALDTKSPDGALD